MMKTHFHTDDAGITESSTRKILLAWETGCIEGFSILANSKTLPGIHAALKAHPEIPVRLAVHLNLRDGRCISAPAEIPRLVNREGHFKISFLKAWSISVAGGKRKRDFIQQVTKEWEAQVVRVQSALPGLHFAALDGHNHIHMIPSLFQIAVELAAKFGIPAVRISNEPFYFSRSLSDNLRPGFFLNMMKFAMLKLFSRSRVCMDHESKVKSRAVLGILFSGRMTENAVRAGLKKCLSRNYREVEVIFHLGKVEETEFGSWTNNRVAKSFFTSSDRDMEFVTAKNLRDDLTY